MSVYKIAKILGKSPSAVSLALNGSPKVSEALKQRVAIEAKRISYMPSGKLSELMSHIRAAKDSKNIGCIAVMSLYDNPYPWEGSLHYSRIYQGMIESAEALGFRLEPLWLKAPGMTPERFRGILEARGIRGMLCFGSPRMKEKFPSQLCPFATVTVGLSIDQPMNRVIPNFHNDCILTLDKLHQLGYRRPGIIYGSLDRVIISLSAYLGWCAFNLGKNAAIPPLELEDFTYAKFSLWRKKYRPDVVILAIRDSEIQNFLAMVRTESIRVPDDIGVAVITPTIENDDLSGIRQNQRLMGERALKLLLSRIQSQDFGTPEHPRVEMVDGEWIDGRTICRQR